MKKIFKEIGLISVLFFLSTFIYGFVMFTARSMFTVGSASNFTRLVLGDSNAGTDPNTTADITLQNDEYISNNSDGIIDFGAANLSTTGTLASGAFTVTGKTTVSDGFVASAFDTIASANTLVLSDTQNVVITGTTSIDSISTASTLADGGIVVLEFSGADSLKHGKNIECGADIAAGDDDFIILQRRGLVYCVISYRDNSP